MEVTLLESFWSLEALGGGSGGLLLPQSIPQVIFSNTFCLLLSSIQQI